MQRPNATSIFKSCLMTDQNELLFPELHNPVTHFRVCFSPQVRDRVSSMTVSSVQFTQSRNTLIGPRFVMDVENIEIKKHFRPLLPTSPSANNFTEHHRQKLDTIRWMVSPTQLPPPVHPPCLPTPQPTSSPISHLDPGSQPLQALSKVTSLLISKSNGVASAQISFVFYGT